MPSGQMVSIEVWSNPTWFNSGTNHPADEKGVLSEIRSETWSSGRIESVFVFLCFWFVCVSFAVSRSYLKQMKVLEERLMYLFIVFCKELLCVSIPFWLKDFHLCVYIFRFPPSLTLFSISHQCCNNRLISQFHPIPLFVLRIQFHLGSLCARGYLQCVALQSVVTFMSRSAFRMTLWPCTMVHRWCHLTRMGCWCHLVKWFRLKYGRIQLDSTVGQTIQQMKRECFLRSEARHGRVGGLNLYLCFCVFGLFAFRLRFLDLISNKWKSLKNGQSSRQFLDVDTLSNMFTTGFSIGWTLPFGTTGKCNELVGTGDTTIPSADFGFMCFFLRVCMDGIFTKRGFLQAVFFLFVT